MSKRCETSSLTPETRYLGVAEGFGFQVAYPSTLFPFAPHLSKAKIRFQSFFMLMIVQPCFFAMSYIAWLKVSWN